MFHMHIREQSWSLAHSAQVPIFSLNGPLRLQRRKYVLSMWKGPQRQRGGRRELGFLGVNRWQPGGQSSPGLSKLSLGPHRGKPLLDSTPQIQLKHVFRLLSQDVAESISHFF